MLTNAAAGQVAAAAQIKLSDIMETSQTVLLVAMSQGIRREA